MGEFVGQNTLDERFSGLWMLLEMQISVMQDFGTTLEVKSIAQFVQGMTNAHFVYRFLDVGLEENRVGARVSELQVGAEFPEH